MSSTAPDGALLVLTTLDADTDPSTLARTLVEEGLAACVNILPAMRSIYRWKGAVEEAREQQLLIKTSPAAVAALRARLLELHPYETPELLVLTADGSAAYLRWLEETTSRRR